MTTFAVHIIVNDRDQEIEAEYSSYEEAYIGYQAACIKYASKTDEVCLLDLVTV